MLTFERHRRIKEILHEYSYMDVVSLSSLLDVSQVTVRKDLEKLENGGILTRVHGGAIFGQAGANMQQENRSIDIYREEKKQLGISAARLVCDQDIVFIGGGSTCHIFSTLLKEKRGIKVITNNAEVARELCDLPNISVICIGGNASKNQTGMYFHGTFAIDMLTKLHIGKAFISPSSVDMKYGYGVNDPEVLEIYETLQKVSDEMIVLSDFSKFNKNSMLKFANIDEIKTVVSNEDIPETYKEYYFKTNICLYTSVDSEA